MALTFFVRKSAIGILFVGVFILGWFYGNQHSGCPTRTHVEYQR